MKSSSEVIGAVGFSIMTIRPGDTNVALGLGDLPIAATSLFLNVAESAALAALNEHLDPGETSLLTSFSIQSDQGVSIGGVIRSTATCTNVISRTLHFECQIHEGEREIARALMERTVVERVSFLARTAAQSIIGTQAH